MSLCEELSPVPCTLPVTAPEQQKMIRVVCGACWLIVVDFLYPSSQLSPRFDWVTFKPKREEERMRPQKRLVFVSIAS